MSYSILLQRKDDRLCHIDFTRDGPGSYRVGWVLFLAGCRTRPLVLFGFVCAYISSFFRMCCLGFRVVPGYNCV